MDGTPNLAPASGSPIPIETTRGEFDDFELMARAAEGWRLNYAFRERFDLTPKQYLKAVQLKRVRQDLVTCEPGATVAEIAGRWGFWHMGQFARDYRRTFNELPSETARGA